MKNSCWLLFSFPISLKKSGDSAVVVSISGEATYHPASGDNVAIQEGSVLAASGELELGANAKVTLFFNGKRHVLDTEGRHDLSQKLQSSGGSVKLKSGGFAKEFEEEMMMAFIKSSDEEEKPGGIGWGARSIIPITPVDTVVESNLVLFIWLDRDSASREAYTFQLFRAGGENPVLQATLSAQQLLIDLSAFAPKEGEAFHWIVSAGEDKSEKAHFTYGKDQEAEQALEKVRQESVYQEAGAAEKLLMEAVALKGDGRSQQGLQKLSEAASRFPENQVVKKMMNSFVTQIKQE